MSIEFCVENLGESGIIKIKVDNNSKNIQGLVAVTDYPRDKALYINIAEVHHIVSTKDETL